MAIERWGSLSVADHNDTTALTANVLLYDRLVMPIYTEAHDRNEREYWDQKGWSPDLQNQHREHLGEETRLAIVIARELNIPDNNEPEIALREAIVAELTERNRKLADCSLMKQMLRLPCCLQHVRWAGFVGKWLGIAYCDSAKVQTREDVTFYKFETIFR